MNLLNKKELVYVSKDIKLYKEISKLNKEEIEIRKEFPSLFDTLELAKNGNRYYLDNYFYKKYYIAKSKTDKNGSVFTKVHFCDVEIDKFLNNLGKKYREQETSMIDNEEILLLFIQYLDEFLRKKSLDDFKQDGKDSLIELRKYLKKKFYYWLIDESDKRKGVRIREIDGKRYKVYNQYQFPTDDNELAKNEVYDKIPCLEEDEEQTFTQAFQRELDREAYINTHNGEEPTEEQLDIYTAELDENECYDIEQNSEALNTYKTKYHDKLTDNQNKRIDLLIAELIKNPDKIYELLDRDTNELKPTGLGKILFPEWNGNNTGELRHKVNSLINSIKKRLDKGNIVKLPVNYKEFYRTTLTKEDNYNYNKYLKQLLTPQEKEDLFNDLITTQPLMDKYHIDPSNTEYKDYRTFPMYIYLPTNKKDYDFEITEQDIERYRKGFSKNIINSLMDGRLPLDGNKVIKPIPKKIQEVLFDVTVSKEVKMDLVYKYITDWSKWTSKLKPNRYKLVKIVRKTMSELKKQNYMLSHEFKKVKENFRKNNKKVI